MIVMGKNSGERNTKGALYIWHKLAFSYQSKTALYVNHGVYVSNKHIRFCA